MRTFWIGVLILVVATVFVFLSDGSEKLPGESVDRTDSGTTAPMIPSRNRSDRTPSPAPEPESRPETVPGEPADDSPTTAAAAAEGAEEPNPPGAMPYPEEGNEGGGGPGVPVSPGVPADALQPGAEQGGGGVGGSGPAPDAVVEAEEAEAAQPESQEPETRESDTQEPETREPEMQEPFVEEDRAEPVIEEVNEPEAVDAEPVIESPAVPEPIEAEPEPVPASAPAPAAAPERAPVVETREGLVLDGRWTVPGKGTSESPYRITWELLVAVQREYEPRLGKDIIPAWISALDGKRVSIEGYSLLPVGTTSMSELLVMLNQWDGCCIGVPPTPYDAVEVRLAKRLPSSAAQMFAQGGAIAYGRVTGTFEVDPYIAQGWLLGLYLINDAEAELFGPAGAP